MDLKNPHTGEPVIPQSFPREPRRCPVQAPIGVAPAPEHAHDWRHVSNAEGWRCTLCGLWSRLGPEPQPAPPPRERDPVSEAYAAWVGQLRAQRDQLRIDLAVLDRALETLELFDDEDA